MLVRIFIGNGVYTKLERGIKKRRKVTTEKYKVMETVQEEVFVKMVAVQDLPGGPTVWTSLCHCRGTGFEPWLGS